MRIALSESFVSAMSALDRPSARRVVAFLGKLVGEADSAAIHVETLREAADKADRSLRVTGDLRAIGHMTGDELVLVFVGEHDHAYRWARDHCVTCHPATREIEIAGPGEASGAHGECWRGSYHALESDRDLCRILDEAGIEHGL